MNQSAWTSVGLLVAMVAAPPLAAQSTASLQAGLPGQPIARRTQRLPPQTNIGATLPPCGPAILSSPSLQLEVLAGPWQVCATPAWPFSAAYSPSGSDLYVPLFGGFLGGGGCTLARVDPVTFQLLATLPTGESPQEVAFVTWPNGSLRLGFVSCSSSSTVTVFDAANQVIATIPIPVDPSGPFATAFPFGLAVSPNGTHVHVGTGDGQGRVTAQHAWRSAGVTSC